MRVVYAFLADAAIDAAMGKIDVTGLGIDHVFAAAVPALHPHLTLVCRLEAALPECEQEHQLQVELWGPDGERLVSTSGDFIPGRNAMEPHRPTGQTLILNFERLMFPVFGDYAFHILVDRLELGAVPLYIRELQQPRAEDDGHEQAGNGP